MYRDNLWQHRSEECECLGRWHGKSALIGSGGALIRVPWHVRRRGTRGVGGSGWPCACGSARLCGYLRLDPVPSP